MAATREAYLDVQQMCDYVLLKHVNVTKEAETEKLYKVQINSITCVSLYTVPNTGFSAVSIRLFNTATLMIL